MTTEISSSAPIAESSAPTNANDGLSADINTPDPEWMALKGDAYTDKAMRDYNTPEKYVDETLQKPVNQTPEETKPRELDLSQKVKLKVNGQEAEVPLNEVIKAAQMYAASAQKLEQLKAVKSQLDGQTAQVQQVAQILKSGNLDAISAVFQRLGVDFNKLAMHQTKKLFDVDMMSPDQKKAYHLEQQLRHHQEQQQLMQQQEAQRIQQYHDQKAMEEIQVEIPKALKEVNLQATPEIIARIAQVWQSAIRIGRTPTAVQVARYVKNQVETERKSVLSSADANQLKALLGDRVKDLVPPAPKKQFVQSDKFNKAPSNKEVRSSPYMKHSDWRKR